MANAVADALCAICQPTPIAWPQPQRAADGLQKPRTLSADLRNLPAALEPLTALPYWLLWRWKRNKKGKWTKRPYQTNGVLAESDNPATWSTYDQVIAVVDQFDGIGFVLHDHAAFDLDKCRDRYTCTVAPWALELIAKSKSYAEVTPSGTGLRVIGTAAGASLDTNWQMGEGMKLEAYRRANRYITISGCHLPGTPTQLCNIDAVFDATVVELDARDARNRRGGNGSGNGAGAAEGAAANDSAAITPNMITLLSFPNLGAGRKHGGYGDRSALAYKFFTDAVRGRVSKENITAECLKEAYRGCAIYEHIHDQGDPRDYVASQIQHAREDSTTEQGFEADSHDHLIKTSQRNVRRALKLLEVELKYDAFHDRILVNGLDGYTSLSDPALEKLWLLVDERFRFRPTIDFFRIVIGDAGRRRTFHPVRDYLDSLTWDGTERLDHWLITYCGAEDTEYVRAVGAITLIAAVCRVRRPGCKFDEMLILESPQGTLKSELLASIAVHQDWFCDDLPLNADSKKVIEQTKGKWIVEAADMSGMRKADVEHLKATLSRQVDRSRLAFGRLTAEVPRQFIVVGTTNSAIYLKDLTGNRRFWPVKIANIDLDKLKADRDQLWAEAAARQAKGESIRLKPELWEAAAAQQVERTVQDPWFELLDDVLGDLNGKLLAADAWKIVGVDPAHRNQDQNSRLGSAMKALGFKRKLLNFDGRPQNGYVRGDTSDHNPPQRILVDHNPPRPPLAALTREDLDRLIEAAGDEDPF